MPSEAKDNTLNTSFEISPKFKLGLILKVYLTQQTKVLHLYVRLCAVVCVSLYVYMRGCVCVCAWVCVGARAAVYVCLSTRVQVCMRELLTRDVDLRNIYLLQNSDCKETSLELSQTLSVVLEPAISSNARQGLLAPSWVTFLHDHTSRK